MSHKIISIDPATNEPLGEVSTTSSDQVKHKVKLAKKAQPLWQNMGLDSRVNALRVLLGLFEKHKGKLSETTCREMGRPIALCESLHDYAVELFLWNLNHAPECLKNETTYEDDTIINEVVYEPLGVIACIMAWNFPIGNFVFSVVQALIAGNTVVIKYSEEIPLFSKLLEEICGSAKLPEGVLSFVHGDGEIGKILVEEDVDLISFTGSSETGRKLHIQAAEKGIPIVLEMGGSSPGIIFQDANTTNLLKTVFDYRFANSGQFCDNLKRLIVHSSLFDYCVDGLVEIARQAKLGNPLSRDTTMGPLVAERQVIRLEMQVKDALDKGAKLICGGDRPEGLKGAWYRPTILVNITSDMRVWKEEVFGPVLPIVSFETYEEAIQLANDSVYGLTGYIFTNNKNIARRAMNDIKAGCIGINGMDFFRPENPFGGYKRSGIGRENGKWGFHDVCRVKVIARDK